MRTQMKRALVFRVFAFRVLGLSLRTSQKQPFFFRVTKEKGYPLADRTAEIIEYKCELLNTNILLLNTNGNY